MEQVFSPHPYPASLQALKGRPLYTDLRLAELAEGRRGQPPWAAEEYARSRGDKGKLAALDLQVSISPGPRGAGMGGRERGCRALRCGNGPRRCILLRAAPGF